MFDSTGLDLKKPKSIDIAIATVGIAMALYHLVSTQYLLVSLTQHLNIHLGFALVLTLLVAIKKSGSIGKLLLYIMIVLTVLSIGYVHINIEVLQNRLMFNTPLELLIGVVLIIAVCVASWMAFGSVLVVVAAVSIAYMFLGPYLPGFLRGSYVEPSRIISHLSINFSGIYEVLSFSANMVFLFVLMGSILLVTGATGFFMQIGRIIGRRLTAGTAIAAVVTSALFGTITGSVGANVATIGSFTIPMMKKAGYKPDQAAAIEAAASTGGQIMPPIMGVAAFAMADITGIPYIRICAAAIIPALLYFFILGLYAQFRGGQLTLTRNIEPVESREMLLRAPLFIIPLGLIVYFMIQGNSLQYAGFMGVVSAAILGLFRKKTRPSLTRWVSSFTNGSIGGAQIAVAVASTGMVVRAMIVTGLGVKLPGIVEAWSGGSLPIALVMVAVIAIILGLGLGTLPVYLLVAMVAAPVLLKMGLGMLQAHFFVFLFGVFSTVTPPVASSAIVASKMANSNYWVTSMEAMKSSLAGFILPFLIVWVPGMLLINEGPIYLAVIGIIISLILLVALQAAIVGYYMTAVRLWERTLLYICVVAFIGYFLAQSITLAIAGLAIFGFLTVEQAKKRKRLPKPVEELITEKT